MKKKRVDVILCEQGKARDLVEAGKLVLAGLVRIGADHVVSKASELYDGGTDFQVETPCPYVSRGAYKLEEALRRHCPDLAGKVAFDVGASTGGFTDLMLQLGAERVYTVDSGVGQLHGKLRNDARVVCRERTNARELPDDFLPCQVDLLTMDVSFISVRKVLPGVEKFLKSGGYAFILVKPQFEARRSEVGAGGVVRDEAVMLRCVEEVRSFAEGELAWRMLEAEKSPLKGPKGNQEYMCVFVKS